MLINLFNRVHWADLFMGRGCRALIGQHIGIGIQFLQSFNQFADFHKVEASTRLT